MKKVLLIQFVTKLIEQLKLEQRYGTAHVYQSTMNRLVRFAKGEKIYFSQLSPEWLRKFQNHLLENQLAWNTISTYMRMLRSIYNQAVVCGLAPYVPYLFSKVHTGIDSPVKRAVSPDTMRRLIMESEKLSSAEIFSRDIFVLLFLLRGMPFVDLAYLRKCDLQGNVIIYHRRKTGRKLTVAVGKEAMAIIRKYIDINPASPYLLPIIAHSGEDEYRQYTRMLRTVNYHLSRIMVSMRLREALSTYVARHTWATTALRQNHNSNLICDAMGHSSVKVTETYFQRFRQDEVNRLNNSVISYILSWKS